MAQMRYEDAAKHSGGCGHLQGLDDGPGSRSPPAEPALVSARVSGRQQHSARRGPDHAGSPDFAQGRLNGKTREGAEMSATSQDFPFTILDVAGLLPLRIKRRTAGSFYVDCPFCGDTKGRLNISRKKRLALQPLRCQRRDAGAVCEDVRHQQRGSPTGRSVRRWGATILMGIPQLRHADAPESAVLLPPAVPQAASAAPQTIHQTLTLLLEQLSLSPRHKAHLLSPKRGLTDAQIERFGFKSTPPSFLSPRAGRTAPCQRLHAAGRPRFLPG